MTVWIIPAADKRAVQNYPKTLSQPISKQRINAVSDLLPSIKGEIYAWGFPANDGNKNKLNKMEAGDICFFYGHHSKSNRYIYAARVIDAVPEKSASAVSSAFWDEAGFLPYLLDKPIPLSVTTEQFGKSLNPFGTYMQSHPMGSSALSDVDRAKPTIEEFGSFDAWALDFIERNLNASDLTSDQVIDYFVESKKGKISSGIQEVANSLFQPSQKAAKNLSPSVSTGSSRRSGESKKIGDLGEKIVLEYLEETLPLSARSTLEWVANKGIKPGWDIQYKNNNGELVAVEVKTTTTEKFQTIEITVNELRAAQFHKENYCLYLIANCMNPDKRKLEVIKDPATKFENMLTPTLYRIG